MSETATLPALIPVEDIKNIVSSAPEVLEKNTSLVNKAVEYCNSLLERAKTEGMSPELDAILNKTLVRMRERKEEITNERMPLTQMFDKIRTVFTDLEKKLDPKNPMSVYSQIQAVRDDYAKKLRDEAKEKELALQRKLAKDKEAIDIKGAIEIQIRDNVLNYQDAQRAMVTGIFNSLTLDTFEEGKASIQKFSNVLPYEVLKVYRVNKSYHSDDELNAFVALAKADMFDQLKTSFAAAIEAIKAELMDKISGKKAELQAIATADAQQKAALEKQRKAREEEEARKREDELLKAKEEATAKVEAAKQVSIANTLFDNQIAKAEIVVEAAPVRTGYEITVLAPTGYLNIVQAYFNNEGLSKKVDYLEKRTLGQMKKFCEELAHKSGEKLDSPFLVYTETIKTTAKK